MDSVQSLEVIPGAPSAEYGGKTSLVIVATTRSGLGNPSPHGEVTASYGSFGSSNVGFNLAYGSQTRQLHLRQRHEHRPLSRSAGVPRHPRQGQRGEPLRPRRLPVHRANSIHLNLGYTRSWFQTPNSYDSEYATQWPTNSAGVAIGPNNLPVGPADQRAQIQTVNFAPSYTRIINQHTVLNANYFFRRDGFNYYPSKNPFADRGAPDLQQETISQQRSLANTGLLSDRHLSPTAATTSKPASTTRRPSSRELPARHRRSQLIANLELPETAGIAPCPVALAPRSIPTTSPRAAALYPFHGHTDIKEFAAYAQDAITAGPWSGNLGLRFDQYNGLTVANQVEPRLALSLQAQAHRNRPAPLLRPHPGVAHSTRTWCSPARAATTRSSPPSSPAPTRPTAPASATTSTPASSSSHLEVRRPLRRLRLEVHPHRIRLLRPRGHAHHLPHRLAQLQDPRLRRPPGRILPSITSPRRWSSPRSPRASSHRRPAASAPFPRLPAPP
jgi:hypothetical protein